jgi:hypothetical protein
MAHPTQGITSAPKLVESATNVLHSITQFRATAGSTFAPAVLSAYVQQSTRRYVALRLRDGSGSANGATATFDTQAGTWTYEANDGTGATRGVGATNVGDSWWRISLSVTGLTPAVGWEGSVIVCDGSGAPAAYAGDGTSGIFAGFLQLEAGTTPGEYLATTGAPIDERFTATGTYSWTATATNEFGSASRTFTQVVGLDGVSQIAPTITTTSLASGTVGTAYSQTLTATGTAPITWSTTGTLPPGLSRSGAVISGTPTAAGTWQITATAANSFGTTSRVLTISAVAAAVVTKRASPWSQWLRR